LAQFVELVVKIGGKEISPISYCSINQRIDWHHSFEILIPTDGFNKTNRTVLLKAKDFIGQKLEISVRSKGVNESQAQNEFYGIITEVTFDRKNKGNKEIVIRGHSPTILLDGRATCKLHVKKTLNDIMSAIDTQINQNDLKINCNPVYKDEIPYIFQYKESNYHFLNRMAERYGEWCFYDGKELNFGGLNKNNKLKIAIDKSVSDFEFSLRIQNLNHNTFTYSYLENSVYSKETKEFNVNDLDEYGDHALDQSESKFKQKHTFYSSEYFKDEKDFLDFNETKKFETVKDLIVAEGICDNPYVKIGSIINITGENHEEDLGEFIIVSLNHTIDITSSYFNHFSSIPAQANIPPANENIKTPVSEIQPAVVTDNDDPEKLGRVKVKFFWQTASDEHPWLRLIHPYGGKMDNGEQHGFYFMPEIGDEVMIGFENNNPDKPFVIGNLYHKNSKPDHWYHADNNIKSLRTRNGNQLIFIDEDGKEEIRILNKDDNSPTNEISLSLNNNGKITIKSVGDLEILAENIKISANTDLTVESGQNTKLTASDYKLDATNSIKITGQQITVEGQNTTTIKGQSQLELEGTSTSMKGQADLKLEGTQLKMEGTAQAELKGGAMVKVEASGTTEVKGAIVMIN